MPLDGRSLEAQPHLLDLTTDAGDLDLTITPSGFPNGYADLVEASVGIDIGDGTTTLIASLRDVIASKAAAGRSRISPRSPISAPWRTSSNGDR